MSAQAPPKRQFLPSWRTDRTPYLKRFYSADHWQAANYARQISDLDARIASGLSWLDTVPTTDQRHTKWMHTIKALQLQRALKQRALDKLKLTLE